MTERTKLFRQITLARSNLLAMTILTVVNIAAYFFNSNFSFPFSAYFPYISLAFGDIFSRELMDASIFYWGAAFAIISLTLYFISYFLSKRRQGWLLFAAILYFLDLLFMAFIYFPDYDFSALIDFFFHFWVLYYLVIGVSAAKKLKGLSSDFASDPIANSENPLQP